MQIRHVLTNISFAQYNVKTNQQVNTTIWFDVVGFDAQQIHQFIKRWMELRYPGISYTVDRSTKRPGYAYVRFEQSYDRVTVKP
jgi:hypothetical protein